MEPKYRYDVMRHSERPPFEYDWDFEDKVNAGWRLVSVVKVGKTEYYSYWEKPYND